VGWTSVIVLAGIIVFHRCDTVEDIHVLFSGARKFLFAATLVALASYTAKAGQIALMPENVLYFVPNTNPNNVSVGLTYGWEFNTSNSITITEVGLFDTTRGLVGLADSHSVAIWDSTGSQLLVSGIVPAGSVGTGPDTPDGESKVAWVPVEHVTLPPGEYVIAAFFPSNNDLLWGGYRPPSYPSTTVETAAPVSYVRGLFAWTTANTLIFPTIDYQPEYLIGYFGPDFQFEASSAPEPSTLAVITIGLMVLLIWGSLKGREMKRRGAELTRL
jgi:hypothetical protein